MPAFGTDRWGAANTTYGVVMSEASGVLEHHPWGRIRGQTVCSFRSEGSKERDLTVMTADPQFHTPLLLLILLQEQILYPTVVYLGGGVAGAMFAPS
jgi:hypothetical protein